MFIARQHWIKIDYGNKQRLNNDYEQGVYKRDFVQRTTQTCTIKNNAGKAVTIGRANKTVKLSFNDKARRKSRYFASNVRLCINMYIFEHFPVAKFLVPERGT
jgi:hypothetical protein